MVDFYIQELGQKETDALCAVLPCAILVYTQHNKLINWISYLLDNSLRSYGVIPNHWTTSSTLLA